MSLAWLKRRFSRNILCTTQILILKIVAWSLFEICDNYLLGTYYNIHTNVTYTISQSNCKKITI